MACVRLGNYTYSMPSLCEAESVLGPRQFEGECFRLRMCRGENGYPVHVCNCTLTNAFLGVKWLHV